LENVPVSFEKRFGHKVDFSKILGIYYDWMDWCQYDEVIPDEDDIKAYKESSNWKDWKEAFSFLKSLK
jgi:hypothetical protein